MQLYYQATCTFLHILIVSPYLLSESHISLFIINARLCGVLMDRFIGRL